MFQNYFLGDTANKIGTYSLALCALHHGVPFYVAAPITSIDLSLLSGDQIVIEERSPKELLCSDGGLGKQVAASGIGVWNPAFDVTPANLITAIITEKVCFSHHPMTKQTLLHPCTVLILFFTLLGRVLSKRFWLMILISKVFYKMLQMGNKNRAPLLCSFFDVSIS